MEKTNNKSGFATAALVVGIIGACISFIPIINNLSFILGILAIIFGIVALVKKASKGMVIAGIILGIVAIAMTISTQKALSDAVDDAMTTFNEDMSEMTGDKTEEILANNLDVTMGALEVVNGTYMADTRLPVTIKNKGTESKSFNIQIEAVDASGNRLDQGYVYASSLGAGQSQEFEIFTYIAEDKLESMKSATFKIVEISMY